MTDQKEFSYLSNDSLLIKNYIHLKRVHTNKKYFIKICDALIPY